MSTRTRSLTVSLATGGFEVALFAACTLALPSKRLVAARWLVGALGSSLNYAASRRWAFGRRDDRKRAQGARFAAATLTSITLATAAFAQLARAGLDPRLAHVASVAVVWPLFTFPAMKLWVFRAPAAT
jgi:hypothetical protein